MSEVAKNSEQPSSGNKQDSQENKQDSQGSKKTSQEKSQPSQGKKQHSLNSANKFHQIRFRLKGHIHSAASKIQNLADDELVMVETDHGQEPAKICGHGMILPLEGLKKSPAYYVIARRASRDEISKYENLVRREQEALVFCNESIKKFGLAMKLIRVERFFNGSKVVFYFTAENRVDFRALVKELVQEFRTRVEMRQIGVRHETQMLGGLGCCGRELCCASFMTKFVPVSIKMAKEQNLPLNPSKISGVCNRLLCCLTHEFDTYKRLKKDMPKPGRTIVFEGDKYRVNKINILKNTVNVTAISDPGTTLDLIRDQWKTAEVVKDLRTAQESGKQQIGKKKHVQKKQQESSANKPAQKKQQNSPKKNEQKKNQPQGKNKRRRPQKKGKKI